MNLPREANEALIDFMGACRRYNDRVDAISLLGMDHVDEHAHNETIAIIRDAEQAIITLFTSVLGEPDRGEQP